MQKAKRQSSRRQAVLVPGMHRSGTSALSGMLAMLGVQAPKSLMKPTRDNPKGYWESTALMRLHDEVLASAGTMWSDWDRFNPAWMESAVAGKFVARLSEVLEQEYGDAELLLVKDPRICRLLPLWLRVLSDLDISPKIVLPVRHPLEVARSLEVRNEFGRQRSHLAWLRHTLDAEFHSRGYMRVVVGYADVLMDWRRQVDRISSELEIKWPKWSSGVEADIDEYLSAGLRHQVAGEEIPAGGGGIVGWVGQAYQAMMEMTRPGAELDDAQSVLNKLRAEFDQSSAVYASVVRECENKANTAIAESTARTSEADERYANLVKEITGLADDMVAGPRADPGHLPSPGTTELEPLIEQLRAERTACAQASAACTERLSDLTAQLEACQDELSRGAAAHEAELTRLAEAQAAHVAELSSQVATQQDELSRSAAAHEAELTRLAEAQAARVAELSSQVATQQEELRRVTASNAAEVEQLSQSASAREAMLADQKQQIDRLQVEFAECLEKHEARIALLAEQHASEVGRLLESGKQSEGSLNERFTEIAKLTTMVFDLERRLESERASRASDSKDSAVRLSALEQAVEKERGMRADDRQEAHALSAGLEKELELHRRLAADRLEQLQRIQKSRSWKAINLTERLARRGRRVPATDVSDASDEEVIRESGLFDGEWYLRRYPDVRKHGLDPLGHYLRYGAKEGRDPSPAFSTRDYVRRYPDVAAAGINPLLHYFKFGIGEGRRTRGRDKERKD